MHKLLVMTLPIQVEKHPHQSAWPLTLHMESQVLWKAQVQASEHFLIVWDFRPKNKTLLENPKRCATQMPIDSAHSAPLRASNRFSQSHLQ